MPLGILTKHCADHIASSPSSCDLGVCLSVLRMRKPLKHVARLEIQVWMTVCLRVRGKTDEITQFIW